MTLLIETKMELNELIACRVAEARNGISDPAEWTEEMLEAGYQRGLAKHAKRVEELDDNLQSLYNEVKNAGVELRMALSTVDQDSQRAQLSALSNKLDLL